MVTTLDSTNNVLCSIQTSFKFQLFGCLSIKISNYFVVESRAIAKYIAEAYTDKETNLISKDPKKYAIRSVWMEGWKLKDKDFIRRIQRCFGS